MNITTSRAKRTPTRRPYHGMDGKKVARILSRPVEPLAKADGPLVVQSTTPPCNTGVETNKARKEGLVDYVRFVVKETEFLSHYLRYFGGDAANWTQRNSGYYGYSRSQWYGEIGILTDGHEEGMGFCVQMSGQACRQFEAEFERGGYDWLNFFRTLTCWGGSDKSTVDTSNRYSMPGTVNVTRLDVALDDRAGALSMDVIKQHTIDGQYSCRGGKAITEGQTDKAERVRLMSSMPRGTDAWGTTVEFGRKSSTQMVRFYDKAAERGAAGVPVECHWIRAEYQANGERAQLLANALALHGLGCVPACMRGYIEFKEPSGLAATNKYKAPIALWWERFLEGWEKMLLTLRPVPETVEKKRLWIERQVALSIALIADSCTKSSPMSEYIRELLINGRNRYKPKHHLLLEMEKKRQAVRSGAMPGLWVNSDGAIVRALPEGATGF